jgi:hypothetical protein
VTVALVFLVGMGLGVVVNEIYHWLLELVEIAREEGDW